MRSWLADRLRGIKPSVFDDMNRLARQFDAVNLGSGTPDMAVPESLRLTAVNAMDGGRNQYSPVEGELHLRSAVAAHAARFYNQDVDPATEISITNGVTEALHAALFSIVNPGDEVIVFEPFYDCYQPTIRLANAVPVVVTLHAPNYRFDPRELRDAFTPRTRAILVNTPHNPTGTVFSKEELALIADLCQAFDVLAITDEVYEHVVFDGQRHIRLATLPGMAERTLTLSGAGKTFSCTGWRIGWAIGPKPLHDALRTLRQFTVFCAPTPLQIAVAAGLGLPSQHFQHLGLEYQTRRDFLLSALRACGFTPTQPAGSFFTLCDVSKLGNARDLCAELAESIGVVPIPMVTFYQNQTLGERTIRFTFCHRREKLEEAGRRLARWPEKRVGKS